MAKSFDYKEFIGCGELTTSKLYKDVFTEYLGTFIYLYLGIASCTDWLRESASSLHIAITMGLSLAASYAIFHPISGANFNPAVTIGFLVSGDTTLIRCLLYIIAQVLAAVNAAYLVQVSLPSYSEDLGITRPIEVPPLNAFLVEIIISFIFVLMMQTCGDPSRPDIKPSAAFLVGLTATACNLASIGYSGGRMNPARSFGPAWVLWNFKDHWLYWVGPCLGGAGASGLYQICIKTNKNKLHIITDNSLTMKL